MADPVSIADVQNALKAGIVSIAGAAAGAVVWADEQRPAAGTLVVLNMVQFSADQDREAYAEDADDATQLTWGLSTLHHIRLQVRCESQYNAPARDALFVVERIRAGLLRPDLVWGAGLVNFPDQATYLHHVPFPHQGRLVSAWAFETNFRAVTDFSLDGPIAAGTNMKHVEVIGADADPPASDQTIDRA
ncbi:MAG: hypothetical protein V4593_08255 [Pseudomonadota bacterium]